MLAASTPYVLSYAFWLIAPCFRLQDLVVGDDVEIDHFLLQIEEIEKPYGAQGHGDKESSSREDNKKHVNGQSIEPWIGRPRGPPVNKRKRHGIYERKRPSIHYPNHLLRTESPLRLFWGGLVQATGSSLTYEEVPETGRSDEDLIRLLRASLAKANSNQCERQRILPESENGTGSVKPHGR